MELKARLYFEATIEVENNIMVGAARVMARRANFVVHGDNVFVARDPDYVRLFERVEMLVALLASNTVQINSVVLTQALLDTRYGDMLQCSKVAVGKNGSKTKGLKNG